MNKQQAIEFVNQLLDEPHAILCNEFGVWYECLSLHNDRCDCGKEQRDVKLQQLLDYLDYSVDFVEYYEESDE